MSASFTELSIPDLLAKHPNALPVLQQYGLAAYAQTETAKHENLKASALVHNVDFDALVKDLESALG